MTVIAERLKAVINKRGISQQFLAEQIGVTKATMSRYINGSRTPKGNIISKLADALNVSTDYLLGVDIVVDPETAYFETAEAINRYAGSWTDEEKALLVVALFRGKSEVLE